MPRSLRRALRRPHGSAPGSAAPAPGCRMRRVLTVSPQVHHPRLPARSRRASTSNGLPSSGTRVPSRGSVGPGPRGLASDRDAASLQVSTPSEGRGGGNGVRGTHEPLGSNLDGASTNRVPGPRRSVAALDERPAWSRYRPLGMAPWSATGEPGFSVATRRAPRRVAVEASCAMTPSARRGR